LNQCQLSSARIKLNNEHGLIEPNQRTTATTGDASGIAHCNREKKKKKNLEMLFAIALATAVAIALGLFAIPRISRRRLINELRPLELSSEELAECTWRHKRFFVLVNPYGGQKAAKEIYSMCVAPTLHSINASVRHVVTEYAGHAEELCAKLNVDEFDVLLMIGGDGFVHEVVNGLARNGGTGLRTFEKISLAVLPAGSGNGLAAGLGLPNRCVDALRRVLLARRARPIDAICIEQRRGDGEWRRRYGVMSLSYGLVAEADELLEHRMRWLGPTLKDIVVPLYLIGRAQTFSARIAFTPAPCHSDPSDPLHGQLSPIDALELAADGRRRVLGPDMFILIGASVTHISHDVQSNPLAQPDDGCLDVFYQDDPSRLRAMRIFAESESGTHLEEHKRLGCRYYKMLDIEIEPTSGGHFSTDGVVLPSQHLRAQMIQKSLFFLY
jgi:diacylglycerol kinase family enzyme